MEKNPIFKKVKVYKKENLQPDMECKYILCTWDVPVLSEEEVAYYFPNLRAIFYSGGTVKYFAMPYFKRNVRIFSGAEANSIPVAEFVLAQIILANKGFFKSMRRGFFYPLRKSNYQATQKYIFTIGGNYDKVVGIIGVGNVGRHLIKLLKGFNLKIQVYDPFMSDEEAKYLEVSKVTLETLFTTSHVITNHLPDLPETKNIINSGLLKLMMFNAVIINTGRGNQINEQDLISFLKQRKDVTALLDLTKKIPLPFLSPLHRLRNVYLTPHIAGSSYSETDRLNEYIHTSFTDYIKGVEPRGEVFESDLKIKA